MSSINIDLLPVALRLWQAAHPGGWRIHLNTRKCHRAERHRTFGGTFYEASVDWAISKPISSQAHLTAEIFGMPTRLRPPAEFEPWADA
jgi:hypothetical protein